jgi:ankyrin repeat protein
MSVIDAFVHACGQGQMQVLEKRVLQWKERGGTFLEESINRADNDGEVPLALCARLDNVEAMKLLLANGADLRRAGASGRNPLQESCKWGKANAAAALLEWVVGREGAGGDLIDAPSVEDGGRTALHLAVYYGHFSCVEVLTRFGANPTAVGDDDKTPLAIGLLYRSARQQINELLVDYYQKRYKRRW